MMQQCEKKAPSAPSVTFSRNAEKSGIELTFAARPDADTLTAVKAAGFRWHNARRVWYAKETPERVALAEHLAGGETLPAVSVAEYAADAETRRGLLLADAVRAETLRRCYAVPGYEDLPLSEKNRIYDETRAAVEKETAAPEKTRAPWAVDKDLLRAEYAKVWPRSEKMVKHCVDEAAAVAVLPDGGFIVIDKKPIEKDFCFGESGYDYEDAQHMADHARSSAEYFKRENMRVFLGIVNDLRDALAGVGRYSLIIRERQYFSQTPDCLLRGYRFEDLFVHDLPDGCRVATPEETRIIIAAAEAAAAAHEKKVDAYLKRYGTTKVRAWTYWRDA